VWRMKAPALFRSAAMRSLSEQPESSKGEWKSRLLTGKRGGPLGNVANALTAIRYAPEWQHVLQFNESSLAIIAKTPPPFERASSGPFIWADEHDIQTAAWLQHQGVPVNREIAAQAIQTVAKEHSFHPIREYLDSLRWDGIPRIDDWLILYIGVDPSDYVRAVGAKFLIGGVARVYQPGSKNDSCLILEGPQGSLKSTALRSLADPWLPTTCPNLARRTLPYKPLAFG
jgi:predicted P-loop ATPase